MLEHTIQFNQKSKELSSLNSKMNESVCKNSTVGETSIPQQEKNVR